MDIVIIGAGGHGRVVLDILRAAGTHRCIGFLDQDPALAGTTIDSLPVLGAVSHLLQLRQQHVRGAAIAVGDNRARQRYLDLVRDQGLESPTLVHPASSVAATASIQDACVIAAGAVVAAGARVGRASILNTNCVVDHECEIETAVHVCPGALLAGRVRVGQRAMIGLGAKVIQCISVGADAVVGAGAVVLRDVQPGATVVGVPAQMIRSSPASAAA